MSKANRFQSLLICFAIVIRKWTDEEETRKMFIAEQKKRENIAEYLLYMWQLEDILRAYELDIDKIQKVLIDSTSHSDEKKDQARQWYEQLIEQMQSEGIEKEGHLVANSDLLQELSLFHAQLLKNPKELPYVETYYKIGRASCRERV